MASIKEIAKEMAILVPKFIRRLQAEFISIEEITSSQIVILMSLFEEGKISVGKLAEQMKVSGPTVTGLVDRLVDNGYIERKRSTEDRRKVTVDLTKAGRQAVIQFQKGIQKNWEEILRHLTQEEREAYLNIIKKMMSVGF